MNRATIEEWPYRAAIALGVAIMLLALGATFGCHGPERAYVDADRATYEAVATEYLAYVAGDDRLDADRARRRQRTVIAWRLRLEAAERGREP